jgi:hypothetical protein
MELNTVEGDFAGKHLRRRALPLPSKPADEPSPSLLAAATSYLSATGVERTEAVCCPGGVRRKANVCGW